MTEIDIRLEDVRFYAYHGVFEQEKTGGNEFRIDLIVSYRMSDEYTTEVDDIRGTVCYASLFEIVKEEMAVSRNLLETVVSSIARKIRMEFPEVSRIECTLTKMHPPIPECLGRAAVTYRWVSDENR